MIARLIQGVAALMRPQATAAVPPFKDAEERKY